MEQLWIHRRASFPHAFDRIVPDGRVQLLVNLDEDALRVWDDGAPQRMGGAMIEGAHDRPFVIDTDQQRAILGVNLEPAGLGAWLPADEVVGLRVDLADLGMKDLRQRLLEARDDAHRLDLTEGALVASMRSPDRDEAMAWAAERIEAGATVGAVQERVGLSPRHFRRRFRERVGLGPKRYGRVRRLQRLLARLDPRRPDWAGLAWDVGFSDQAHLIREFRALVGLRPTEYLARGADGGNHVPEGTKPSIAP